MLGVIALAGAMLLTQNAQQFDLTCTGTMESGSGLTSTETVPANVRLRVDLARNIWCEDECGNPAPFVSVNAGELVMFDNTNGTGAGRRTVVNRTTGTYTSSISIRSSGTIVFVRTTARCTRAPYTPIPAQQF